MFLGSIEMSSAVTEFQGNHDPDWTIICGNCGCNAKYHPINNEFLTCNRTIDSFPNHFNDNSLEPSDYYYNPITKAMFLANDYSGYAESEDEPEEYESADDELVKLNNWRDVTYDAYASTWVSTVTLEQHQTGIATEALIDAKGIAKPYSQEVDTSDRTAYVEGHEGFIARTYLDDILTRKYHARLLNVFKDKRTGDLRIGSIRITKQDDVVIAECVNSNCPGSRKNTPMWIRPSEATREHFESFIEAVIRHGNNHAANWFRERDTYYKLHKPGCDIKSCDPNTPECKVVKVPDVKTTPDVVTMFDHQTHCTNANCACDKWLAQEVPVLAQV